MTTPFALRLVTATLALALAAPLAAQDAPEPQAVEPPDGAPAPPPPADQAAPPPLAPAGQAAAPSSSGAGPTPPPLPEEPQFFIEEDGAAGGPYELADLRERVASGALGPDTLAWMEGMDDWAPASQLQELTPLFVPGGAQAPIPAASEDPAGFLAGRWRQQGPILIEGLGRGQALLTIAYRPDGTFAVGGAVTVEQEDDEPVELQVTGEGRWEVSLNGVGQLLLANEGTLTLTPSEGRRPLTLAVRELSTYEVVDEDTIREVASGDSLTRA